MEAEYSAGRITRPLRGNGFPYQGINVLMLWSAGIEKGYAAPMTFKQASELKAMSQGKPSESGIQNEKDLFDPSFGDRRHIRRASLRASWHYLLPR